MPNPSNSLNPPNAPQILDEQFLTVRAGLIEIAADLDRIDRAAACQDANGDKRMQQIRQAIKQLLEPGPGRAERLQLIFSLPHDKKTA